MFPAGAVGSLTGDWRCSRPQSRRDRAALRQAAAARTVSSFHVIGEIFDKVRVEGGDLVNSNVQTTPDSPRAARSIVEFKVEAPGTFIRDHLIFRNVQQGLVWQHAKGSRALDNKVVCSGSKISTRSTSPEGSAIQSVGERRRALRREQGPSASGEASASSTTSAPPAERASLPGVPAARCGLPRADKPRDRHRDRQIERQVDGEQQGVQQARCRR